MIMESDDVLVNEHLFGIIINSPCIKRKVVKDINLIIWKYDAVIELPSNNKLAVINKLEARIYHFKFIDHFRTNILNKELNNVFRMNEIIIMELNDLLIIADQIVTLKISIEGFNFNVSGLLVDGT